MPDIEHPPLYSRDRKGALLVWRVYTVNDLCITEHGKLDGKQTVHKDRCKPMNVGRANATTGETQAHSEALSAWTAKLKEGYQTTIEAAQTVKVYLPMLAHPRDKGGGKQRNVGWPCWAQPKFNGLRCLAFIDSPTSVRFVSRQGTEWTTLDHIAAELLLIGKPGDIFDGEVYIHGVPLQTLNSYIKKKQQATLALQYWVYDMPRAEGQEDGVWEDRWAELQRRVAKIPNAASAIRLSPTWLVQNDAEVRDIFAAQTQTHNYEGLILRQTGRVYEFANRTDSLLKVKPFIDGEFKVVGLHEREYFPPDGGESYNIVDKFVVANDLTEATFEVVPKGSMEQRRDWLHENKIGEMLVVRYLERSKDLIPQGNPVGVCFRLQEDQPAYNEDEITL